MFEPIGAQVDVLTHEEGALLVAGGPGSGKTLVAIHSSAQKAASLTDYQRVLFLSLTRVGIHQVAQRAFESLLPAVRRRVHATTFHGLYYSLVRSLGTHIGLPASDVRPCPQEEADLFQRSGLRCSYEDLECGALELLRRSDYLRRAIRDKYPYVVVDEFQDTTRQQWEFLQVLTDWNRVLLLGDPDQAIYSSGDFSSFQAAIDEGIPRLDLGARSMRDETGLIPRLARAVLDNENIAEATARLRAAERLDVRRRDRVVQIRSDVYWAIRNHRQRHPQDSIGVLVSGGRDQAREIAAYLLEGPQNQPGLRISFVAEKDAYKATEVLCTAATAVACGAISANEAGIIELSAVACLAFDDLEGAQEIVEGQPRTEFQERLDRLTRGPRDLPTAFGRACRMVATLPSLSSQRHRLRLWRRQTGHLERRLIANLEGGRSWDEVIRVLERERRARSLRTHDPMTKVEIAHFHGCKGREYDAVVLHLDGRDAYGNPDRERRQVLYVVLSRARSHLYVRAANADLGPALEPIATHQ